MNITKLHIDEIKPYWRNPRKNEKAIEAVKESIKQYGYNSPIVVDTKHVIIAGHTRYKALRQLGYEEISVIVLDITEDKAKQYRIADNKAAEKSTWDNDLLMFELREIEELADMKIFFNDGELDDLLDLTTEDEYILEEPTVSVGTADYSSSPEYDKAVEERVQQRLKEEEERRQEELEKENKEIMQRTHEMSQDFEKRSETRQNDFIKIKCPHCDESLLLSKSELLRKDKILQGSGN